jgi:hypothetical protein
VHPEPLAETPKRWCRPDLTGRGDTLRIGWPGRLRHRPQAPAKGLRTQGDRGAKTAPVGPLPGPPNCHAFCFAACRLIAALGGHHPASPFASGTPSHPEPQTAGRSLGFRITSSCGNLRAGLRFFAAFCPNDTDSDHIGTLF